MRGIKVISVFSIFALHAGLTSNLSHAKSFNGEVKTRVSPALKIVKLDDLFFGSISPDANSVSTVVVDPSADGTSICGPLITCIENGDRARFRITGRKNTAISVTVTNSITLSDGGSNVMIADNFTLHAAGFGGGGGFTQGSGALEMGVGATLHIGAGQAPGLYTGSFVVTADYQ